MENIDILTGLFKIDNKPLVLTEGQKQIFEIILKRNPKRTIVMCATQYGKSLAAAAGRTGGGLMSTLLTSRQGRGQLNRL